MITIEFKVKKQTQTAHRFCKYIIHWIKRDFKSRRNREAIQLRLDLLQHASWMKWIGNPHKIDAETFVSYVNSCLSYTVRQNTFIIYIDDRKVLPGTYTPISKVLRYVDYGNELVPGCMIFTSILRSYRKSIDTFWFVYKLKAQSK